MTVPPLASVAVQLTALAFGLPWPRTVVKEPNGNEIVMVVGMSIPVPPLVMCAGVTDLLYIELPPTGATAPKVPSEQTSVN